MKSTQAKREDAKSPLTLVYSKKAQVDGLPDLFKMKFLQPYKVVEGKRKWNFKHAHFDCAGVLVFKNHTKPLQIFYATNSMYEVLLRRVKDVPPDEYSVCLYPTTKERAKEVHKHVLLQAHKLPLATTYQAVKENLSDKQKPEKILSLLEFKSPYVEDAAERICAFDYKTWLHRKGVYVITENGMVVYVGSSTNSLYKVVSSHFTPFKPDRIGKHKKVTYFDTYDLHKYDVAMIEVPGIRIRNGKEYELSPEKHRKRIHLLEKELIAFFWPRDNDKDKPKDPPNASMVGRFIEKDENGRTWFVDVPESQVPF